MLCGGCNFCTAAASCTATLPRAIFCSTPISGAVHRQAGRGRGRAKQQRRSAPAPTNPFSVWCRCKISDFGKAKRIPQGVSSVPLQDEEALAVNWLAPEVLQRRLFFLPSETWSFGVAVWELFSHGALPYGHLYSVRTTTYGGGGGKGREGGKEGEATPR